MLTVERHNKILDHLKIKEVVTIQELVKITESSESTIRRDLAYLEKANFLKRIHGGATLLQGMLQEPDFQEKAGKNIRAKLEIGKYAASLIENGECIYLDAGTSTLHMIDYFDEGQDIVVVTNGLAQIDALIKKRIRCYILGGVIKPSTGAVIGTSALKSMDQYRFDKCFLGTNGIHSQFGFTTPDIEESAIKQQALKLSLDAFVLADHTKFNQISFGKFADIKEASIITDQMNADLKAEFNKITKVKVVKE